MNEKNPTTRPCIVKGTPCKFHMFVRNDRLVIKTELFVREEDIGRAARSIEELGFVPRGFTPMAVQTTAALIEWPNGSVTLEPVNKIRFTDREEALE